MFSFHSRALLQTVLALWLFVFLLKSVRCDFSIFSAVMPRSPALCVTWLQNSIIHSPSSVIRDPRYENVSTCSSCSFSMTLRLAVWWWHEQPLIDMVEALGANIFVQFPSLAHHATSLHPFHLSAIYMFIVTKQQTWHVYKWYRYTQWTPGAQLAC